MKREDRKAALAARLRAILSDHAAVDARTVRRKRRPAPALKIEVKARPEGVVITINREVEE